jgi:arsenate reductase-like glutaredoxin family protein
VLNAELASPQKALSKKELQDVLSTLGSCVRETFNLERPRYHKVICRGVEGRPDPSSQRNSAHVVSAHIVPFSA